MRLQLVAELLRRYAAIVACCGIVVTLCAASAFAHEPTRAPVQKPAQDPAQASERAFRSTAGSLTTHPGGTYQLSADATPLHEVVAALVDLAGVEISLAEELANLPVTIETDVVSLADLLAQLRAAIGANLIVAASREGRVSRAWLTATDAQRTPAVSPAANPAAAGPLAGTTLVPGQPPPIPVPTGQETRAVGELGMDVAAYIEQQRQAALAANAANGAGAGTPGAAPGAGPSAGAGAPGAGAPGQAPGGEAADPDAPQAEAPPAAEPPIPMDPNALEKFFAGDSRTKHYHRLNCIQAMYVSADAKVWFRSREEAIAAGYTPHEVCVVR